MADQEKLLQIQYHLRKYGRTTATELQKILDVSEKEIAEVIAEMLSNGSVRKIDDPTYEWIYTQENVEARKLIAAANGQEVDVLCKEALRYWLEKYDGKASIASLQRHFAIGFNRSGRIMDTLQKLGYVYEPQPDEPYRTPLRVLVNLDEVDRLFIEHDPDKK